MSSSNYSSNSSNASPINAFIEQNRYYHSPTSSIFNPYASSDGTSSEYSDSAFFRYLRSSSSSSGDPVGDNQKYHSMIGNQFRGSITSSSGSLGSRGSSSARSPFSAIENIETPPSRSRSVFTAPVNVEEDVIVMDGVLVESVAGARRRCLDSGGSSSSGSNNSYKKELCRSREDSGNCRDVTKCQFAHGKENSRPNRLPHKSKSEAQVCKTYTGARSCSYGSKFHFLHHGLSTTSPPSTTLTTPQIILPIKVTHPSSRSMITSNTDCPPQDLSTAASPSATLTTTSTISAIKLEHPSSSTLITTNTDWSPLVDGIEVTLPFSASADKAPSRKEVDAYIQSLLYGPSRRKRLPVFVEICPD